jgi:predicted nucleic acid-binding protein
VTNFFDTNILIYAQQRGEKAEKARALLARGGQDQRAGSE